VTAIDINDEVLAIARTKPLGKANVRFERADACQLAGLKGPFDAALAAFWWSHVPKARLPDFLRQLHAALEPGALVMFIDNAYVEGSSTPISRADTEGNTYQQRRLDDGSTFEVLKNFPSSEELLAMTQASAARVDVRFLDYYWVLDYELPVKQAS
jgi:demethylmenaquinone methyltransferase/2-methoxy-6-polyprenyl-1,4-benzoquinol methylase